MAEPLCALADCVGVNHCIAVSSGTDALIVALMALGRPPGDEVKRRAEVGAIYSAPLIERGARVLGETQQGLRVPYIEPFNTSVYAQYTLQSDDRDAVIARLQANGIPTAVH